MGCAAVVSEADPSHPMVALTLAEIAFADGRMDDTVAALETRADAGGPTCATGREAVRTILDLRGFEQQGYAVCRNACRE